VGVLEVALVRVEDDGLLLVVALHHEERKVVDGGLHVGLLSINEQLHALLLGVLCEPVGTCNHARVLAALILAERSQSSTHEVRLLQP